MQPFRSNPHCLVLRVLPIENQNALLARKRNEGTQACCTALQLRRFFGCPDSLSFQAHHHVPHIVGSVEETHPSKKLFLSDLSVRTWQKLDELFEQIAYEISANALVNEVQPIASEY